MNRTDLKKFLQTLSLMALVQYGGNSLADNTWNYLHETDRLTNLSYSYALSPLPRRDLYDDIRLEVACKNKTLHVNVNTENLIASQGRKFDVSYQVDKSPLVSLQMKTFPDSKRKGYTDEQATSMIRDLLAGKESVFLRITTITKKVLAGSISLAGAEQPIQRVLADCGVDLGVAETTGKTTNENAYDLAAFEKDFQQLSADKKKQLLKQIKQWLAEPK